VIAEVFTALPFPAPLAIALAVVILLRGSGWNPFVAVGTVGHWAAVALLAVWTVGRLIARRPLLALASAAAILLTWVLAPVVSSLPGAAALWVLGGIGVIAGGGSIAYAVRDNARTTREITPPPADDAGPGYEVPAWVEEHL
jgi:hypothetical protein